MVVLDESNVHSRTAWGIALEALVTMTTHTQSTLEIRPDVEFTYISATGGYCPITESPENLLLGVSAMQLSLLPEPLRTTLREKNLREAASKRESDHQEPIQFTVPWPMRAASSQNEPLPGPSGLQQHRRVERPIAVTQHVVIDVHRSEEDSDQPLDMSMSSRQGSPVGPYRPRLSQQQPELSEMLSQSRPDLDEFFRSGPLMAPSAIDPLASGSSLHSSVNSLLRTEFDAQRLLDESDNAFEEDVPTGTHDEVLAGIISDQS
jgi:hypothetical protein